MRLLEHITPVVLTFNEAANIGRCLAALRWAARVVVVDSGSTDETRDIAASFPNVAWFTRPFDTHQAQWKHAVFETAVDTEYVLALDADMTVTPALLDELARAVEARVAGALVAFDYCYEGRPLHGSVYPAQVRLFRRNAVAVEQRGHTQHFSVLGPTPTLAARLLHDDRKPLERWVAAQLGYSRLEARRILGGEDPRGLRDMLRRTGLAPVIVGAVAYARAGGFLGGRLALRYAIERSLFEGLLAIRLLTRAD